MNQTLVTSRDMAIVQRFPAKMRLNIFDLLVAISGLYEIACGVMKVASGKTEIGSFEVTTWASIAIAIFLYKILFKYSARVQDLQ
jgi:hypothetical protein